MRRLLALIPTLLGVSVATFLIIKLIPGDIALTYAPPDASAAELQALRESLGLTAPLPIQYAAWLGHVLQGDWGYSISQGKPVLEALLPRLQNTMILAFAALIIAWVIGVTAGIVSAARQGSVLDRGVMVFALLGNSMPAFWLGLVFILFFGLQLGILPVSGMYSPRGNHDIGDLLVHLVLPASTLGLVLAGLVARMTRSAMLEIIRQDYIRTAWAKGLRESAVMRNHALRNAILPVITVLGLQLGNLLGGSVIIETVYSWPGIGFAMQQAILRRDAQVVQGGVLLAAISFVFINLIVDLLYAAIDPRVKFE